MSLCHCGHQFEFLFLFSSIKDAPEIADASVKVLTLNVTGKVRVTWSRPSTALGQVITGYLLQYRRRGYYSYFTVSVSGSNTTSYTISNLNLGTVYEVRIASVGPLGWTRYCCGSGKQIVYILRECTCAMH